MSGDIQAYLEPASNLGIHTAQSTDQDTHGTHITWLNLVLELLETTRDKGLTTWTRRQNDPIGPNIMRCWMVGWLLAKHHIQWTLVLTGTLTLFQAAREWRCCMQLKPRWLNLEAKNLPLAPRSESRLKPEGSNGMEFHNQETQSWWLYTYSPSFIS